MRHKVSRLGQKLKQQRLPLPAVFIAVFALIGFGTLLFSQAASQPIAIEAEAGTASSNACATSDATASGGSYVKFSAAACSGGSLPAGVTLQDIDGGQAYYEQWANTMPSARQDPAFFPIAIFQAYDLNSTVYTGMSRAASHKAVGINSYGHLANGAYGGTPDDMQVAKNNGMYVVAVSPEPDVLTSSFSTTYGKYAAGYGYQDEIDGKSNCNSLEYYTELFDGNCIMGTNLKVSPQNLLNFNQRLRAKDNTRPIYQGYTNAYAVNWYPGGPVSTYAAASDIIGYDIYPMVDRRNTFGGSIEPGHVWSAYNTVMEARSYANFTKPIWPDIESSPTDWNSGMNTSHYMPTPAEVQALAWNYIVGGARGIAYFNHCFCNGAAYSGHDDLNQSSLANIRAGVAEVNARIKALAPVINAKFANGYETHTGQINTMVKYYNGSFYIFAAPKASGAQTITFTPKTGSSVTVVDENRTINYSAGKFTDTFANENTIHIYKVNP